MTNPIALEVILKTHIESGEISQVRLKEIDIRQLIFFDKINQLMVKAALPSDSPSHGHSTIGKHVKPTFPISLTKPFDPQNL